MTDETRLRLIRIFLASPNDVTEERAQARHLIKDDLAALPFIQDDAVLRLVAWEDPTSRAAMPATLSPQKAIELGMPKPSQCDIVVVVFWSRMGTPLDEARHGLKDGKRAYWSGTEWEYEDALKASEATGKPVVLVYRRTARVPLNVEDHDFDERVEQYKRVKEFFDTFRDPKTGAWLRSYTEHATPEQFGEYLKKDLMVFIKQILEAPPAPVIVTPTPEDKHAEIPWPEGKSPFPGLHAFTPDEKLVFFGRGRETDALIQRVKDSRFVAVIGASGSGKSSLVGAGLIPRLADNAFPGSKDWQLPYRVGPEDDRMWAGPYFKPGAVGNNPFAALAASLAPLVGQSADEIAAMLERDPAAIAGLGAAALAGHPDWAELLLFIDQFEELFTVVHPDHRAPFVALLNAAAHAERLHTVVTMRADFYHACLKYSMLEELLRAGSFPLGVPGQVALHEMIARPADRAKLTFEDGLPERILDDAGNEPGNLALVAYTLDELYQACRRANHGRLSHRSYEELRGVQGAIGTRASSVFAGLEADAQATLPHVFRELVEVDERGTATRQRAPLARFENSAAAMKLIRRFTDARLLTTTRLNNEAVVEVAHEALFRSWDWLAQWIEDTQDDLRLLRQVKLAALEWDEHGRDPAYLWPDERLEPVYEMQDHLQANLDAVTREFIRPETDRLLAELRNDDLPHARRLAIGERLAGIGGKRGDSRPGARLREDGLPDLVWCAVPGGSIVLGDKAKSSFFVQPFYIAQYPITFAQFQTFIDAEDGFHNPQWWEGLAANDNHKSKPDEQWFKFANHPREDVSWWDAVAFCRWLTAHWPEKEWPDPLPWIEKPKSFGERLLGQKPDRGQTRWAIRLPTEWEWQQAATGGHPENVYPWGPEWDERRANTGECGLRRTTAVGMYPLGAACIEQPDGETAEVMDMSGNVWQWCLNEHDKPENFGLDGTAARVLRGGAWANLHDRARAVCRYIDHPGGRLFNYGFRVVCARPPSL
jgi:hypothetical protein